MVRALKELIRTVIPRALLARLLSTYHLTLAELGAFLYGHPSRYLTVIGVTGTKGKSSVTEMINAILEEAGHKTVLVNSIRFKRDDVSKPNLTRMTMPGRFFVQRFLSDALKSGCTAAVLEMTSEGAQQHRHRALELDALVFLNLAPEHIESHGSFEAYADAKFELAHALTGSRKRPRIMVANADDKESMRYLTLPVEHALPFALSAQAPFAADETSGFFTFDGTRISLHTPGIFSLRNALAAATLARALGVKTVTIASALERLKTIPGRAERVEAGQAFTVVVDYAHTPDSLAALFEAYKGMRKFCVLGATGGGRDTWKRPVMGALAEKACELIVITEEDPYDEDPKQIADDIAHGMTKRPTIILDRRQAIRRALEMALDAKDQERVAVLITGKGSDPSIVRGRGAKIPWSDVTVARDELAKVLWDSASRSPEIQ